MNALVRIKRAVIGGRYRFSKKALAEMDVDNLTEQDVTESILTSATIYKTIRSRSPFREHPRERLYIIQSRNLSGTPVYPAGPRAFRPRPQPNAQKRSGWTYYRPLDAAGACPETQDEIGSPLRFVNPIRDWVWYAQPDLFFAKTCAKKADFHAL